MEPTRPTPGTKLNVQFGGATSWGNYLDRLKQARGTLRAVRVGVSIQSAAGQHRQITDFLLSGDLSDAQRRVGRVASIA